MFDAIDGGARKSFEVFHTEGMKVAAATMRKKEDRVKAQDIQEHLAGRVEKLKDTPNAAVSMPMLFEKIEHDLVECHRQMNEHIFDELNQQQCKNMNFFAFSEVCKDTRAYVCSRY